MEVLYETQMLTSNGEVKTTYQGDNWDDALHQFTLLGTGNNLIECKERWLLIQGIASQEHHNLYAGAPSWSSLTEETRDYLTSIGLGRK